MKHYNLLEEASSGVVQGLQALLRVKTENEAPRKQHKENMLDYLDPILLARIQFAFTISFTSFSQPSRLALPVFGSSGMEMARYEKEVYRDIYKFWVKILPWPSGWASYPAWSCRINLAPTGHFFGQDRQCSWAAFRLEVLRLFP